MVGLRTVGSKPPSGRELCRRSGSPSTFPNSNFRDELRSFVGFFSFRFIFIYVCVCMSVCHMYGYLWRTKEEFRSSTAGVTGRCDVNWGMNWGPLQVFLTTGPPAICLFV